MQQNEQILISKAKNGNTDSFETLMEIYINPVRSYIGFHLPIEHCVDEVCQNTFITAYRKINSFEKGSFKSWILTIAKFQTMKHIEKYKRQQRNVDEIGQQILIEMEPSRKAVTENHISLEECMGRLQQDQVNLLHMSYEEGLLSNEIASRLGRERTWVRTTLMRLRKKLKECIESLSGAAL